MKIGGAALEAKVKHLEFIQAAINRMAGNSFLLKGWTVTLTGGLFALTLKETDRRYPFISILIIILFWSLDSYYLSRERCFIALFDLVRVTPEASVDFCMRPHAIDKPCRWRSCAFSKTVLLFYGGLLVVSLLFLKFA